MNRERLSLWKLATMTLIIFACLLSVAVFDSPVSACCWKFPVVNAIRNARANRCNSANVAVTPGGACTAGSAEAAPSVVKQRTVTRHVERSTIFQGRSACALGGCK
jgi:hypothetical protein